MDDTHAGSTVNTTVNAPKYETPINVDIKDINVGDTAVIKVITPKDATGNVTLEIDGEKYTAPIEDGVATFEIDGLTAGTKTIAIDYAGDDEYLANNTASKITVSKVDSFIRAEITDIDAGENVTITVYGPSDATGQVLIDIDGVGYYVNITNGVGTTEIPRILSGVYNVNLTYLGDEKYLLSSNVSQFNVSKIPSFVIPSAVNITVGETEVIRLLVPDDATGIVTVVIDGEKFMINLDDDLLGAYESINDYDVVISRGHGMLVISGLPKGQYMVSATYNGDRKYLPSYNETLFTVGKKPVELEIIDYGNGTAVVNVLPDNATGNITLEIANKTFTAPIINGTATFDLDGVTPGTYDATAYYPGDNVYENQTTNGPITIPKVPTPIDATGHDINVGESEVITVYVEKDATGEVSVEINGKTYTGTVENGVAKITVPDLPAGDYETVVKYSGDDKYLPATDDVSFSVNKIKSSIIVSADDITEGDDAIVIVKLPADATGTVTITVGGKQYTADVVNGIAKFIIPGLTKGNYTVSATYSGDDKYEPAENATDLEVFSKSAPTHNETANKTALNMEVSKNATGNPILVLLLVLLVLGSTQIRRFKK